MSHTAPKQQRFCLARDSEFTTVMEMILKGEIVYIKNTGVKVFVQDINYHKGQRKDFTVQIRFEDVPTKKSIEMCENFHVRANRGPNTLGSSVNYSSVSIDAHIKFTALSAIPYETKAAKTLYKKQK